MVGGHIIDNVPHYLAPPDRGGCRRLWCMDRNGDECIVYAETAADVLECGEEIWWQAGTILARGDTLKLGKIGYSHRPKGAEMDAR